METPRRDTSTVDLVVQGAYHLAGISQVEETAEHVDNFQKVQDALRQAWALRFEAEQAAAAAQSRVLHVDVEMDALLLAFGDAVLAADAEGKTNLHALLFPTGIQRVVEPVGVLQTEATHGILKRLAASGDPVAKGLSVEWAGPLGATLGRYDALIEARDKAEEALAALRAAEESARDAWFQAVTTHLTLVGESFPESAFTRALFFPPVA